MNPYPAPWSVLILNNCRIHHVDGVEEMCNQEVSSSPISHCIHRTSTQLKSAFL
ncbi:hypothetical protein B0H14DRAFT_2775952, partial [Mycena olivaceomarginata]